jgi:hypothetical protein
MTRPVTIPNTFATATGNVPASQLDTNFSTLSSAVNDPASYTNYAVDTGAANAYVVTLSPAPSNLASMVGVPFIWKASNNNTTASTINLNSFGVLNLTNYNAGNLVSGAIVSGNYILTVYDGTQFRILSLTPSIFVDLLTNQTVAGVKTFSSIPQGNQYLFETPQYFRLNADLAGANVNTVQSIFGVGVTLAGSTVYEFEIKVTFTKTAGTTAHNFSIGFGGSATINNILYQTVYANPASAVPFATPPNQAVIGTASSTQIIAGLSSATQSMAILIKGTVSVNAGGTFIPQYTLSAAPGGAYSTLANSDMKISIRGASGSNTSVGTWA